MKRVRDGYNDFYHEEDFPAYRGIEYNDTWVKYEVFVSGDETNDLFKDFHISDKAIEYAKSLKAEGKSVIVYKTVYSQYGEEDSQIIWEDGKDLRNVSDSRKIKDSNIAYSVLDENDRLLDEFTSKEKAIAYAEKNNKADGVVRFKYSEDGDVLDAKEIWTKNKSVSDSRKIKDGNSSDNFEKWEISTADKNGNSRLVCSYNSFDEALSDYKEILERNKNSYYALDGVTGYNTHTTLMPVRYMPYYENYYGERINGLDGRVVSDSRKIKDADETQDVLDGILMIAFNDGSEDEGYNEVKKHANEQGELDGVQYETYDTDIQDGVTLIDLCAATDDANTFVKALLTEWGIIDAVADIEFEKSELMENAEEGGEQVSDSKVEDMTKPAHLRGYAEKYRKKRREQKESYKENEEETQNKEVSDSRKIKDARPLKEQNIWISFKEYAQDILDKAENDEEWYVKTYPNFRWYGVYEDGVPMTAEVYSNGGDSWSFEVYLANELEEMMLNVMQMPPSDSYLRFGGEDYVDEGRTPNAISFEDFFDFYADNLW